MKLLPGARARTTFAWRADPEHLYLYPSQAALRAAGDREPDGRTTTPVDVGITVTVAEVAERGAPGIRPVRITGPGWSGWVDAERALVPIPPPNAPFTVDAGDMLYPEQDDDEGRPFGAPSRVTFLEYTRNPGNPEYLVRVDDGPLAGLRGYLEAQELHDPVTRRFALQVP